MEWSKNNVLKLIELYEQETVLWNITNSNHKNSNNRVDALKRIADSFGDTTLEEIEKKIHNLRSQYLREKTKIEKSKKSGVGAKDVYVPKWQYFLMLGFLSNTTERVAHTSSMNVNLNDSIEGPEEANEDPDDPPGGDETLVEREPIGEPVRVSKQQQQEPGKKQPNKRPPPSKVSGLEKKINHAYEVLTSSINKSKDEDVCFGEYVGESLKKFHDRKTKAWIRHSISNILYQAECGLASGSFTPPTPSHGHENYFHQQHNSRAGFTPNSSNSFPSSQSTSNSRLSPINIQTNEAENFQLLCPSSWKI